MPSQPRLTIKRVYDPPAESDGRRVLVDRLWPRGLSKDKAHLDLWLKAVAPSADLRKWFDHDPAKWDDFRHLYFAELDHNEAVGELREQLGLAPATLSAHLNVLRAAGLVSDEREGRVIRVRADYPRMDALLGYLTENCCAGAADCGPASTCPPRPARTPRKDTAR